MESGRGMESVETDNDESWLPLLILLFNFLNALSLTFECLSLKGFINSRVAEIVSTVHSVVLGINPVTKLMSPIQTQGSRKVSATFLNFDVMESGRGRESFFSGVHSHGRLQRKEGIDHGLKLKHQERNKWAKV